MTANSFGGDGVGSAKDQQTSTEHAGELLQKDLSNSRRYSKEGAEIGGSGGINRHMEVDEEAPRTSSSNTPLVLDGVTGSAIRGGDQHLEKVGQGGARAGARVMIGESCSSPRVASPPTSPQPASANPQSQTSHPPAPASGAASLLQSEGSIVETGGQVANSAAQEQALEETSEEPGGVARSVVPRAFGGAGAGANLSTTTINNTVVLNDKDSAEGYARFMVKSDFEKRALDIAAQAGSTDAAIKLAAARAGQCEEDINHASAQTMPQRLDTNRKAEQDMDKVVNECLEDLQNDLGKLSDEWDFGDEVSIYMSKILRICKPVCPNFDIDDHRGKFARLVRATLKKLQMSKEQCKRVIELVNEQWAKGGGQKKVCACVYMYVM